MKTKIETYVSALKECIETLDATTAKNIFAQFAEDKKNASKELQPVMQKEFTKGFSKLEYATLKQLTKVNESKVTPTSEVAKEQLNILLLPYEEQRKKVRNMLNNICKSGNFELHFAKKEYLTMFDTLTENEFTSLYCGSSIKKETLIRVITQKLLKEEKNK